MMLQNFWERKSLFAVKQDKQLYISKWMDGASHVQYLQYLQLFSTHFKNILKTYF